MLINENNSDNEFLNNAAAEFFKNHGYISLDKSFCCLKVINEVLNEDVNVDENKVT